MLLLRLAETWQALAATRSRNAKRDLIAGVLADAEADEVETVVSYLGGSLRQRRTGLGWSALRTVPDPAPTASLTVSEVDAAFGAIAELSGPGSATARAARVRDLFGRATGLEQRFLRGLVFGDLRQGALESQVQEGLATAYGVPLTTVRRAAMLLSSTTAAAALLLREGPEAVATVGLTVGRPVQPMLAASAAEPEEVVARTGLPALVDHKLDGIRIQVHRLGDEVRVFTRSLEDITSRLPEIVAAVRCLPLSTVVLDGEVLALRPDGRPETFQRIAARTATRAPAGEEDQLPLRAYFFDLLHVDGRDLLDTPLQERVAAMERLLPDDLVVPRTEVHSVAELAEVFAQSVRDGFEGVVAKRLGTPYAAGRRESSWVKLKPRYSFDLVVTAVEWGSGRREGYLSNVHVNAVDPRTGGLVMLGKTFKGQTDELLAWQTEHFQSIETGRSPGVVHVQPTTVVEIACDGLQTSTRYPGGVALRFARVRRYRPDKRPEDADTIDTVKRLLPVVDADPGESSRG